MGEGGADLVSPLDPLGDGYGALLSVTSQPPPVQLHLGDRLDFVARPRAVDGPLGDLDDLDADPGEAGHLVAIPIRPH